MDLQSFLDNVRDLTDLELAILLSLIAQQHCLIKTEDDLIDDLSSELALIASEVFKLSYAVVSSEDLVTVERFGEAILDQDHHHDFGQPGPSTEDTLQPHSRLASVDIRAGSIAPSQASQRGLDSRTVANIVIAKNFNRAPRDVQIASLELITRRRIYSRTTVHQVPKTFLFLPLISTSTKHIRLNPHLNNRISISHYHNPADGFANLEELDDPRFVDNNDPKADDDENDKQSPNSFSASQSSFYQNSQPTRHIPSSLISTLRQQGQATTLTPEIRRHIQDIVVFLRIARGVDGGVTPFATTQFVNLAKSLAPLHGIDFVTPSLVALACRKIYTHRIVIAASAERERSVQWGSEVGEVAKLLHDLTPEIVIEEVLVTIPSPV